MRPGSVAPCEQNVFHSKLLDRDLHDSSALSRDSCADSMGHFAAEFSWLRLGAEAKMGNKISAHCHLNELYEGEEFESIYEVHSIDLIRG